MQRNVKADVTKAVKYLAALGLNVEARQVTENGWGQITFGTKIRVWKVGRILREQGGKPVFTGPGREVYLCGPGKLIVDMDSVFDAWISLHV
jgi:hypothetical protein